MLDAMLVIFVVILGPKVGGWMDKMASWAGAGRLYVWTRISPINLSQVDVWTGSVGGEDFFFYQNVGSAVQKYSNLAKLSLRIQSKIICRTALRVSG